MTESVREIMGALAIADVIALFLAYPKLCVAVRFAFWFIALSLGCVHYEFLPGAALALFASFVSCIIAFTIRQQRISEERKALPKGRKHA